MKNQPINYIQEKRTGKYRRFYSFVLLWLLLWPGTLGQTTDHWIDIPLIDTMEYALFGTNHIPDRRYPPGQLFDADINTCWVSKIQDKNAYPSVFIVLPKEISSDFTLQIFSGYGKNKSLFLKNARPESIQISLYTAIVPDGYASEYGFLCKAVPYSCRALSSLKDTFGIQNIPLQISFKDFLANHRQVLSRYKSYYDFPVLDTLVILKLELLSTYPGTVYDDICISELFLNNCYLSTGGKSKDMNVDTVYINEDENTLMIDTDKQKAIAVYTDTASILQIADITHDKKWAILISMPRETHGRIETRYRMIDIAGRDEISDKLEYLLTNYMSGEPLYLEQRNGRSYLVHRKLSDKESKIELINFK